MTICDALRSLNSYLFTRMPFSKSLSKVTKKLSKQPGALHAKGRKFKQITRATERDRRLKEQKHKHDEQKNHQLLFWLHFQESIADSPKETFLIGEIVNFTKIWIEKDDAELAEIDANRRPGRPLSSKHQLMKEKRKHEQQLFETGIRVPDLTKRETVLHLRNWNGTSGAVSGWSFRVITDKSVDADVDAAVDDKSTDAME